jgi:hypothetical protein
VAAVALVVAEPGAVAGREAAVEAAAVVRAAVAGEASPVSARAAA